MRKKPLIIYASFITLLSVLAISTLGTPRVLAFNANYLIDDTVFDNSSSMNTTQTDNFLNTFSSSCISSGNGFRTPDPQGWSTTSNSYTYGNNVTAGQAIVDAATHYSVSPKTLLTTMQKEQSLFTGGAGCYNLPSAAATVTTSKSCTTGTATSTLCTDACPYSGGCVNIGLGYGCPYYCYASEEGFSGQLIRASWTLRFSEERAYGYLSGYSGYDSGDNNIYYSGPMTQGWRQRSATDTSTYYDGTWTTSDGTSINVTNGATAALYSYTPFVSGNKNFDNIFQTYFGGIYAVPYAASMYAQSTFPTLSPGQSTTVYIEYQNEGGWAWYDDSSITSAPSGTDPVHLATSHPLGSSSPFAGSGWANARRPAVNFAAVYASDGSTLTSNQHVVLPGQIAKFSFTLTVPWGMTPGTYTEYFQPVAEGSPTGAFSDPGTYLQVNVPSSPAVAYKSQSAYPTVVPSASKQVSLSFTNTGNVPLYDDSSLGSAPPGTYPVHLATDCPINSSSDFSASWYSSARPAVNFSAVYNADGTTLASNQHVAQPGQVIKYNFNITVPAGYAAGTYKACFQPILEGTPTGYFPDLGVYLNVTVPSTAVTAFTGYPSTINVAGGEPTSFAVNIENLGNASLPANSTITTSNGSSFQDKSWSSSSAIATLSQSIAAGASVGAVPITLLAPTETTLLNEPVHLDVTLPSGATTALTSDTASPNTTVWPENYHVSFYSQSAYQTLSYGQTATVSISYKNTGNLPWRDDTGMVGQDTRNTSPIHLATAGPLNRGSGFATSSWANSARPAVNFSAVYNADGTTLASNQHVAQPGQIVTFTFTVSPQGWVKPDTYSELFQPIAEGTGNGATNFVGSYLNFTVPSLSSQYQASFVTQSSFPTISPGQSSAAYIQYKNNGSATWYDNTDLPPDMFPIHLATTNPINRSSNFSATWPVNSRPDLSFSKVYESDGTTLAANQHEVLPGQIVEFDFTLSAPSSQPAGTYSEYFQPILEGASSWNIGGTAWLNVTIP